MRDPRRGPPDPDAPPPAPVVLEPGPWWTGRRLRLSRRTGATPGLPLWARLGVASPLRLEATLAVMAILAAAIGGGLIVAALFTPGSAS